jgi:hypothetical protein
MKYAFPATINFSKKNKRKEEDEEEESKNTYLMIKYQV